MHTACIFTLISKHLPSGSFDTCRSREFDKQAETVSFTGFFFFHLFSSSSTNQGQIVFIPLLTLALSRKPGAQEHLSPSVHRISFINILLNINDLVEPDRCRRNAFFSAPLFDLALSAVKQSLSWGLA